MTWYSTKHCFFLILSILFFEISGAKEDTLSRRQNQAFKVRTWWRLLRWINPEDLSSSPPYIDPVFCNSSHSFAVLILYTNSSAALTPSFEAISIVPRLRFAERKTGQSLCRRPDMVSSTTGTSVVPMCLTTPRKISVPGHPLRISCPCGLALGSIRVKL